MASPVSIYARAFVDVIFDSHLEADAAMQQLSRLKSLLVESSDLRKVWENPAIPAEQKRGLLDAISKRDEISRPVRNMVAVLIDHRRIHFFQAIVKQVEKEIDQRMGFAEAEITSARDLDNGEKRALEAQVEKLTGKKVRAQYDQDRSLLGGAIVRIGSTIYDGSVKGQLERIREAISS